jgi:hypothetical protein
VVIATPQPDDVRGAARSLLDQGYAVAAVAARTGLPEDEVRQLADTLGDGDVGLLAKHVNARLRELGMSQLAASKLGILSRSTLANLGKDGRIPSDITLAKLDDLLSWESGSARGVLFGAAPVPREQPHKAVVPEVDIDAEDDFMNLARHIEERLRELNMSKSKFAAIGGPGRSTLATLGKRGYHPSHDTLERIDTYLMWEPGSAFAALKGGLPIRRGPAPTPHPSLIPLNAIKDRLRAVSARLRRQEQSLAQTRQDIDEMLNHVNLVISDLGDPRRRDALWSPGTDTSPSDDAADED